MNQSKSMQELMDKIEHTQFDPASIKGVSMDCLMEAFGDAPFLVDPSNPFNYSLEMSTAASAASALKTGALTRKCYPALAVTEDELYNHMSDHDYLDRFAKPCRDVPFMLVIPEREILENAVSVPGSGIRRIVIPADTTFVADGLSFYLHYPIMIDVLENNDLQINMDTSIPSPLKEVTSNIVDYNYSFFGDEKVVVISLLLDQLSVVTRDLNLSSATGFQESLSFADDFHHCRVYHRANSQSPWIEIKTTHSDMVYDQRTVTATLKVVGQTLEVSIPEIYLNLGTVHENIRVDVFTTRGEIHELTSNLPTEAWEIEWANISRRHIEFVAPLNKFRSIVALADGDAIGGSAKLPFDALLDNVVNGAGSSRIPVTDLELKTHLNEKGYDVAVLESSVLGRKILSSRSLSVVPNSSVRVTLDHSTFSIDRKRTDLDGLVNIQPERMTVTPKALLKRDTKSVKLLGNIERDAILALTGEQLINELNDNDYLFSPFFTVLDETRGTFRVRSYYMDEPKVVGRSFNDRNTAMPFSVNTRSITAERIDDIYRFTIVAGIPADLEGLCLQVGLGSKTLDERSYVVSESPVVDGTDATFTIDVKSSFDINDEDNIELLDLINASNVSVNPFVPMNLIMDLVYTLKGDQPASSFEDQVHGNLFSETVRGVTSETNEVSLGSRMDNYMASGRTVAGLAVYDTYDADVPLTYQSVVYERGPSGEILYDMVNNAPVLRIAHNAGDTVLDAEGAPVILHKKGDPKLDINNNPIELEPTSIVRELTIPMYDARFDFATTDTMEDYRSTFPKEIVRYLSSDIQPISQQLIERSDFQFSPPKSNSVSAMRMANGDIILRSTNIAFRVQITLNEVGFVDVKLKDAIRNSVKNLLISMVTRKSLTSADLYSEIKPLIGSNLISFSIDAELPSGGLLALVSDTDSFAMKTRLKLLSNGVIDLEPDIEIDFDRIV